MANKEIDLSDLGRLISDGDIVGIGGGWFSNHPMAAVRQLIRSKVNGKAPFVVLIKPP